MTVSAQTAVMPHKFMQRDSCHFQFVVDDHFVPPTPGRILIAPLLVVCRGARNESFGFSPVAFVGCVSFLADSPLKRPQHHKRLAWLGMGLAWGIKSSLLNIAHCAGTTDNAFELIRAF
jgi:hypothetical protein